MDESKKKTKPSRSITAPSAESKSTRLIAPRVTPQFKKNFQKMAKSCKVTQSDFIIVAIDQMMQAITQIRKEKNGQ